PVHLRGTGESFAANVGGRLIGTSFFAVTQWLAPMLPVKGPVAPEHKLAYAAAAVGLFVGVVGIVAGFFLPEPKSESLAE
ncbi:MAG: MFS transporter, partial [Planctomycetia bacterium]|nr:MFS transporter [Planctomycetia bacterium]